MPFCSTPARSRLEDAVRDPMQPRYALARESRALEIHEYDSPLEMGL